MVGCSSYITIEYGDVNKGLLYYKRVICKAMKADCEENYMDCNKDFATVNLILASTFETRGVDAFALSLIKAEKQMRRIFTFLIFQNPNYDISHFSDLRNTLAANRLIYFDGFLKGINLILSRQIKDIYGDNYETDIDYIVKFAQDRNKIFHGQITASGLTRDDLLTRVGIIKGWCERLGDILTLEIGYNGFSHSYRKSELPLILNNLDKFDTIGKYKAFLITELQRKAKY